VTDTAEILLGIIAFAVAIMAVAQVGAILAGLRVARRVEQIASELETGVKPLLANLSALSADAARAANLAAVQVERFDKVFADLAIKVEQTVASVQQFVGGPAREGMAIIAGLRAAMGALKGIREGARRRSAVRQTFEEEEESLFIG